MSRFGLDKAGENVQAVRQMMRELCQAEGIDVIHHLYADTVAEMRELAYAKRYNLKKSTSLLRCLCRLAGKQCPWKSGHGAGCITFHGIDHFSLWNRNGKPFVCISQPYGIGMNGIQSLVKMCEEHHLEARIDAYSWWYPDSTIMIEIHREGWAKELADEKPVKMELPAWEEA